MSEEGTGNTQAKASEILQRRGTSDRAKKLERAIERGEQRSHPDEGVAAPVQGGEGRPAKPIRITVDLSASQHRFLREYCLDIGSKGTVVLRGLLTELAEDEELRSRLAERLRR